MRKSGLRQISRTDPESRFLRSREGWQLGYSAEIAVSEDHLIVAQRVTQNASDNGSLLPLVDEASRQCRDLTYEPRKWQSVMLEQVALGVQLSC